MNQDRPSHYKPNDPYEPRRVIHAWQLGFNLGNVIKYISRAGKKQGESLQKDLNKARTYIEFELEDLGLMEKPPIDENQPFQNQGMTKLEIAEHVLGKTKAKLKERDKEIADLREANKRLRKRIEELSRLQG